MDTHSRMPPGPEEPRTTRSRPDTNGSKTQRLHDCEAAEGAAVGALTLLLQQVHQLVEYASHYAAAKTDGVKLSVRHAFHRLLLTLFVYFAAGACVVIASWLLLSGTAEGVGVLCGGPLWVGRIVTGGLLLAGIALGMYRVVSGGRKASRKEKVARYEKRRARQRAQFGRGVGDPAPPAAQ